MNGVRETSLQAYQTIQADGTALTQAARILDFIRNNPGCSRADVERGTRIKVNAVCGRVKKLLDDHEIRERGEKVDPVTHKTVMRLEVMPVQQSLDLEGQ